jgi:hypothetical protein
MVTPMIPSVLLAGATMLALAAPVRGATTRLQVAPLGEDVQIACACSPDGTAVVVKGADGRDAVIAPEALRLRLDARIAYLRKAVRALRGTRGDGEPLATRRAELKRARALLRELPACSSGAAFDDAPPPSFALLCQHGFAAPTAAVSPTECGVDLRPGPQAPWSVTGATGILDELLDAACTREGGVYQRRAAFDDARPLYHGVCAHPGRPVVTDYGATARVLNMEQEPGADDCIRRLVRGATADDPCGGYQRPHGGGGGGGGGGGSTPPTSTDCLILQMEEEPTGCE